MITRFACLGLVFALTVSTVTAQPEPPEPGNGKALVTKVYNIKPLLGARGKATGLTNADEVVKLIFQAIPTMRDLKPGADGPQIVERDGGKLEVRATAKIQDEIKDLLDALARLQDLAVDLKTEVIELVPAAYEKLVKAAPKGKVKPPVLVAVGEELEGKDGPAVEKALGEMNKVLKTGRVVQTSSGRFINGWEATVSARRTLVTFADAPDAVRVGGKADEPVVVKEGFSLMALPVVSNDRRFIRFKLTEQSTIISGVKKGDFGEIAGEKFVMKSLETEDLGATGSASVADGGLLIFRLAYAPKDKVWVVVLHPTIYIKAEQDELKKEGKKP